jgi:G3E family GTPase
VIKDNVTKDMQSTPFAILTGFLGSGKTTLLNRLLADPRMSETAVLVNEVGEIGLDHWLLEAVTDGVVLLESGCVCCSVRDDLAGALGSLLEKRRERAVPQFRRIILETTGIAVPGPIVQLLLADAELAAQLRPISVSTVVDALLGQRALELHVECSEQVAMADRLVVSKLDLAEPDQAAALHRRLRCLNSSAPVLHSGMESLDPDELFGTDAASPTDPPTRPQIVDFRTGGSDLGHHEKRFTTFSLSWDRPLEWPEFEAWLEGLLIARGEDILRLKGLLNVAGRARPVVVQGVQHTLYPPTELPSWPGGPPRTELTFVTRDFSKAAALRSLEPFFDLELTGAAGAS